MELKLKNKRDILSFINQKGGRTFLDSLCIGRVRHRTGKTKCPICNKCVGSERYAWMLTNTSGSPVFKDRFDDDSCAELVKKCLYALWAEYRRYLGPKKQAESSLTEDELRDPFPMKDDESLKAFSQRFKKHLEQLEEVTP